MICDVVDVVMDAKIEPVSFCLILPIENDEQETFDDNISTVNNTQHSRIIFFKTNT